MTDRSGRAGPENARIEGFSLRKEPADMILYTPPKPATSIPVIDLTESFASDPAARQRVAWEIHRACRESGFFYVKNHRIAQTLIDQQFLWAKRLFNLPLQAKLDMHMKKSPSTAGYEPIGGQIL